MGGAGGGRPFGMILPPFQGFFDALNGAYPLTAILQDGSGSPGPLTKDSLRSLDPWEKRVGSLTVLADYQRSFEMGWVLQDP